MNFLITLNIFKDYIPWIIIWIQSANACPRSPQVCMQFASAKPNIKSPPYLHSKSNEILCRIYEGNHI